MIKQRLLFVFTLLVTCLADVYGGIELRSRQLKTNDGLPNNTVRYLFQDSKGFLWIGTLDGLSCYDGNTIKTFQPENGRKTSLADNRIYNITEDKHGYLWIGTTPRLYSCYHLKKARFVDYMGPGEEQQNYSKLFLASSGDVWLWHPDNGARRIVHQSNERLTSTPFKAECGNLPDNRVNFVQEDAEGRVWIATKRGLAFSTNGKVEIVDRTLNSISLLNYNGAVYFLTEEGGIYCYRKASGVVKKLAELSPIAGKTLITGNFRIKDHWMILTATGVYNFNLITSKLAPDSGLDIKKGEVICDNQGNYWIYNHTGRVHYILASSGKVKTFQLIPENKLSYIDHERYHIVHDSRGIVWISTYGNGLFAYDIAGDKLNHFTAGMANNSHLSSDFLLSLMEDRAGDIWVGSEYSGVTCISVVNEGTTHIFPEKSELFDRSNAIRMIAEMPNREIGIATRKGGLYTYDSSFQQKKNQTYFHSNVYAMVPDAEGRWWIGTRGEGLRIGTDWYRHNALEPSSLSDDNIFAICRDRKNRMWIGTFGGGLNLAEPIAGGKYRFRHFFQRKYGMQMIRSFQEDKNGMIWMGTNEGICIFNPDSLIADFENYHWFSRTNGKFCSNEIKCIFQDSRQQIWAGTSGMGLNLCVPQNNYQDLNYEHYGVAEGLANNVVQSILEDKAGKLWVATEYGISKFDPDTHLFGNYFSSTYALSNVYSENCAYAKADGTLLFGTNYGLAVIDPEKMLNNNDTFTPVVLTDLYINGILVVSGSPDSPLSQSLAYSEKIILKHFQNSFQIDFSTFDYSDSRRIKYMYRLENYDEKWSTPSSLNFASYKYLNPGTYVLRVKSCNGQGIWNEQETILTIEILPPFWKTGWAFICYFLLIMIALYFAFHIVRNFNRLRNRIAVEKQLTDYKLAFFTNISHEFRTPLTLIQGALERLQRISGLPKESAHPLQTMNKSSHRMLRLVNQLLEFRKMQNNKLALSLEETDVIAFLYEIFLSFSDVAEQKKMDFQFNPSIPSFKMFIDKGKLDKVAYNLLSNAFKYTPSEGCITLSIQIDEMAEKLRIQVADTGVGIPKEKQHELFSCFMQSTFSGDSIGVGLHLAHELIQVHKGNIEYVDRQGGGSVFIVTIPIDSSLYCKEDFLVPDNILLEEANGKISHLAELSEEFDEQEMKIVPLNKRRILIIEDDNDIRQFLKEEISLYFEVEVAIDGTSGFEKACSYEADLIICDVLMPGMTGFEVTKKLKSDFATSHIPIILLTALNSQEKHLKGIESGADAYITKPFSIKLLLAQVFRLVEQRERLREKYSNEPGNLRPIVCETDKDKEFADRLAIVLEKHISRPDFTMVEFASLMKLGRTVFYRKLRGVTGYSPNEYLRIVRMKKAAELLLSEERLTVAEVAYRVGIDDPFYFSRCFKTQFGVAPSIYQRGTDNNSLSEE